MIKTLRTSKHVVVAMLLLVAATQGYGESHKASTVPNNYSNNACVHVVHPDGSRTDYTWCQEIRGNANSTYAASGNITGNTKERVHDTFTYTETGEVFKTGTSDKKRNFLFKDGALKVSQISISSDYCNKGRRVVLDYDYKMVGGKVIIADTEFSIEDC
jgi:hypothetical protein